MENEKTLILLTNYYPFFKGEEYLESELPYLAQAYRQIFVIPVMYNKDMKKARPLPKNVTVVKTTTDHSALGKLKYLFRKIDLSSSFKSFSNHSFQMKIKDFIFEYYFYKRSGYVWREIKKKIELITKCDRHNHCITIYSYWLYLTASIAVEIKKELELEGFKVGKIVSRAHGYDVNEKANSLNYLPAREYLLSNLDWVFPVSSEATNRLSKKYPHFKEKIETRHLAVKKINGIENVVRSNECINIITCSTVRPLKRLDLLIDALSIIDRTSVNFNWTHIGSGEKKYEEKIEKYAQKKLPKASFKFTGYLKNSSILEMYKNSEYSVFLNISSSEGVPVSIMEAFSAKLPVIATNVGGTSDIVVDQKNGMLIDECITAEQLANTILSFHHLSGETYDRMSRKAYETWKQKLNVDVVYKNFANWLYEEK